MQAISDFSSVLFFSTIRTTIFAGLVLLFPGYSPVGLSSLSLSLSVLDPHSSSKNALSQRRMQVIQPKIKAIQEEFIWSSQDRHEMMELLPSVKGVNLLGSCLPILIQIPILIVLYQVILHISDPSNFAHLNHFSWLQELKNVTLNT